MHIDENHVTHLVTETVRMHRVECEMCGRPDVGVPESHKGRADILCAPCARQCNDPESPLGSVRYRRVEGTWAAPSPRAAHEPVT